MYEQDHNHYDLRDHELLRPPCSWILPLYKDFILLRMESHNIWKVLEIML
jgi:hypothetical protein